MRQIKQVLWSLTAVALVGCPNHEPTALHAQTVLLPQAGACEYQAQSGSAAKSLQFGTVDLTVSYGGYIAGIQLRSGLGSAEQTSGLGASQGYLETNFINVIGASISYEMPEGLSVSLPSHYEYTPTSIEPGQVAVAITNLFPEAHMAILKSDPFFVSDRSLGDTLLDECFRDANGNAAVWPNAPIGGQYLTILVKVVFDGQLLDGTEVKSNEFAFPVKFCMGCLLAGSFVDAQFGLQAVNAEATACSQTSLCTIGQDFCQEYQNCAFPNFNVLNDPGSNNTINNFYVQAAQCATDPGFGTTTLPNPVGICGNWNDAFQPGLAPQVAANTKYNQLLCRLLVSRLNAFCSVNRQEVPWK